jgi:hypothetical protein
MRVKNHTAPALKPRPQFTRHPAFSQGWRPSRQLTNADLVVALACGAVLAACCLIPFLPPGHH